MIARTLPVALAVFALAGCSQVAALAPVGGDDVSEVRFATIDVLLDQGVEVLEAPTCEAGSTIACTGTTMGGDAITASSTDGDLTVSVDGTEVFSGRVLDVLDEAASQ